MDTVDAPEDLYGLPLERFIEARTALARELRSQKQADEAKSVAKLRKPTVAAWAVNQLVRTQPAQIDQLLQAGNEIAEAQAGGRSAAERLRDATKRQRAALDELMAAAEGLLDADGRGLTSSTLEKVSETLRSAAIDPEARDQITRGCLTQELQSTGVLGMAGAPTSADSTEEADAAASKAAEQALQAAREQAKHTINELDEAKAERDDAKNAAAHAEQALKQAEQTLKQAEKQAKAAAAELERAQRAATDARPKKG